MWEPVSLKLTVSGRDDIVYFGLAETGSTCSQSSGDCWTGEDCVFGFAIKDPQQRYCHPISPTGVGLAYASDQRDALEEGAQTGFRQISPAGTPYNGQVTFYLEDEAGCCYSFGHNPGYYDALGCTQL